ncbi:hypothetical protein [Salegentibacter chungangensis]|uniref:Uncharacterized protein n=1 Tax=Salegentibacter chungangensis TaxID=1335724 RepID=A0ABW3NSU1_9FLAO
MKNTRLIIILLVAAILLLIPLVAMQFTGEVNWTLSDFAVGGVLLFGTGLLMEFILRKNKKTKQRILLCAALIAVFLLVWAELAVGVLGTPFAGS